MLFRNRFPMLNTAPADGGASGGAAAPAASPAVTPPAVTPPAPATPPATATPAATDLPAVGEPGWVRDRMKAAKDAGKKEARKELKSQRKAAVAAGAEAQTAIANAKSIEEAAKTALDAALLVVPEAERAAILKAGGGKAADGLKAFAVWQAARAGAPATPPVAPPATPPTSVTPPAVTPPIAPPVAAPLAPPANTAAPPAPPPAGPAPPVDHLATYNDLRATNPLLAQQYLLWNQTAIFPDKPLKTK